MSKRIGAAIRVYTAVAHRGLLIKPMFNYRSLPTVNLTNDHYKPNLQREFQRL